MKYKTWLVGSVFLIAMTSVAPSSAVARLLIPFSLESNTWNSSHVVLVDAGAEGSDIKNGEFTVLQSWCGDLPKGAKISLPQYAAFAKDSSVETFSFDSTEEPTALTCRKMVLFLNKQETKDKKLSWVTAIWNGHPSPMEISLVWIEDGQVYASLQPMNPGPYRIMKLKTGFESFRTDAEAFIQLKKNFNEAINEPSQGKRALALREFVLSESWHAQHDGFKALGKCGEAAAPIVDAILADDRMLKHHGKAIECLGNALGDKATGRILETLREDTKFWQKTAPSLPVGWWNSSDLDRVKIGRLQTRYSRLVALLRTLAAHPDASAESDVKKLRDFWRSLPQLEDKSGLNQISENCDRVLLAIDQTNSDSSSD